MKLNIPPLKRTLWAGLAAMAATAAISLPTQAQVSSTNLYGANGTTIKYDSASNSYGARLLDTTATTVDTSADDFWVYCLDPRTGWVSGSTYKAISGLDNWLINVLAGQTSTYAKQLYDSANYSASAYGDLTTPTTVRDNLVELFSYAYADSLTSDVKSAAFQYAVWEIVGEKTTAISGNPYSRTTGFIGTYSTPIGAFTNQVDTYLSALFNNSWSSLGLTAANYTYTVYSAVGVSQSFIRATPVTPGTGVPEPTSLALVGLAGGLVWRLRRPSGTSKA